MHLGLGRVQISSQVTRESARLSFAVLHMGDHNVVCGVCPFQEDSEDQHLTERLTGAFSKADTAEVVRLLDESFGRCIRCNRFSATSIEKSSH